jgi:hypothetical protein
LHPHVCTSHPPYLESAVHTDSSCSSSQPDFFEPNKRAWSGRGERPSHDGRVSNRPDQHRDPEQRRFRCCGPACVAPLLTSRAVLTRWCNSGTSVRAQRRNAPAAPMQSWPTPVQAEPTGTASVARRGGKLFGAVRSPARREFVAGGDADLGGDVAARQIGGALGASHGPVLLQRVRPRGLQSPASSTRPPPGSPRRARGRGGRRAEARAAHEPLDQVRGPRRGPRLDRRHAGG